MSKQLLTFAGTACQDVFSEARADSCLTHTVKLMPELSAGCIQPRTLGKHFTSSLRQPGGARCPHWTGEESERRLLGSPTN